MGQVYANIETDLPVVGIGDLVVAMLTHTALPEMTVQPSITRVANGTVHYDASYVATYSGMYDMSVTLNSLPISGAWQVTVTPAATHASSCEIGGIGLAGSVAGQSSTVELYVKDQFGNLVPDEPEEFQLRMACATGRCIPVGGVAGDLVQITDPSAALTGASTNADTFVPLPGDVGFYLAQYYVTISGEYDLSVQLQGAGFVGTPQTTRLTIHPTVFNHAASTAQGQGLMQGPAGTISTFQITAKDMYNNQLTQGGHVFSVQIRGPSFILGQVTDTLNGLYTVSFEPVVRGEYRIEIKNQGIKVPCKEIAPYICEQTCVDPVGCEAPCPQCIEYALTNDWIFNCSAAATTASRTFAYGEGIAVAAADDTVQQQFTVRALDKFGIEQEDGGEAAKFDVSIKEQMDGTELSPVQVDEYGEYKPLNTKAVCLAELPTWKYYWGSTIGKCFKTVKNFTLSQEHDMGDGSYNVLYHVTKSGIFNMHVTFSNGTAADNACSVYSPTGTHTTPTTLCGPVAARRMFSAARTHSSSNLGRSLRLTASL
jgi:hypothetical protein